jgi:hypothetical protein
VSSTAPKRGELTGTHRVYRECTVQIGLDEASVVDLPSIHSLHHLEGDDLSALKYLLWGDDRPPVSMHEQSGPPAPFAPPDLIVQVVDATSLQSHLELTLELSQLGRPIVLALNHMDEALRKRASTSTSRSLEKLLGMPVVPTVALMGQGIAQLFAAGRRCAAREATSVRCRSRRAGILRKPAATHGGNEPSRYPCGVSRAASAVAGCNSPPTTALSRASWASIFPACCPSCGRCARRPGLGCRVRWPKNCMPIATIAPRRWSRRPCAWGRPPLQAAGATGSTSCSCIRAGA